MIKYLCDGCGQEFTGHPDHRYLVKVEGHPGFEGAGPIGVLIVDICKTCRDFFVPKAGAHPNEDFVKALLLLYLNGRPA